MKLNEPERQEFERQNSWQHVKHARLERERHTHTHTHTDTERERERERQMGGGVWVGGGGGRGDQGVVGEIIGCGDDGVKRRRGGDSFVPDS